MNICYRKLNTASQDLPWLIRVFLILRDVNIW